MQFLLAALSKGRTLSPNNERRHPAAQPTGRVAFRRCDRADLLCVAAKDWPKRMQNPAAKRHKYTDRISGEEQCGWSELSSRLAKISITQNKNLAVLAKNEAYAPRSLSSE